jgi:hypothetical protein
MFPLGNGYHTHILKSDFASTIRVLASGVAICFFVKPLFLGYQNGCFITKYGL